MWMQGLALALLLAISSTPSATAWQQHLRPPSVAGARQHQRQQHGRKEVGSFGNHSWRSRSAGRGRKPCATLMSTPSPSSPVVALTRERGKNAKLKRMLEELGVTTLEIPCIAHTDGEQVDLLPDALASGDFDYVVVTSPEAAKVFLEGWTKADKPVIPVACVGKATGQSLSAGGVSPAFTPSLANAETLARELPIPPQGKRASGPAVLYPASAKAANTLVNGLSDRGFSVTRLNTYNTVPAEWGAKDEEEAAGCTVVTFGSPTAVKTWTKRLGTDGFAAACIGLTSADACLKQGWGKDQVFYPPKPGMAGWLTAVRQALEG